MLLVIFYVTDFIPKKKKKKYWIGLHKRNQLLNINMTAYILTYNWHNVIILYRGLWPLVTRYNFWPSEIMSISVILPASSAKIWHSVHFRCSSAALMRSSMVLGTHRTTPSLLSSLAHGWKGYTVHFLECCLSGHQAREFITNYKPKLSEQI